MQHEGAPATSHLQSCCSFVRYPWQVHRLRLLAMWSSYILAAPQLQGCNLIPEMLTLNDPSRCQKSLSRSLTTFVMAD